MNNLSQFYAAKRDAVEYQYKIIFFIFALYICYFAFVSGAINIWLMTLITTVLTTRWMIAFHELFHLKTADELDLLNRLLPIPFAPVNLGYREYREIHFRHHKYSATPSDPDAFHILGGPLMAFIGALTQHEQASFRYLREHGLTRELAAMIIIRLSLFTALMVTATQYFLWWFLVLRLTYTINDFVFFHLVHYRSGSTGTFSIPLPVYLRLPAILIYGYDVVYATMYHDIHHEYPRIAARYLPGIAREITKKEIPEEPNYQ